MHTRRARSVASTPVWLSAITAFSIIACGPGSQGGDAGSDEGAHVDTAAAPDGSVEAAVANDEGTSDEGLATLEDGAVDEFVFMPPTPPTDAGATVDDDAVAPEFEGGVLAPPYVPMPSSGLEDAGAGTDARAAYREMGDGGGRDAGSDCVAPSLPTTNLSGAVLMPATAHSELVAANNTGGFASVARVPAANVAGCAASGYTGVDFCHNVDNPPAPSIARRLGRLRVGIDDGNAPGFPNVFGAESSESWDAARRPRPRDRQVLPYARSTVDGRVLLDGRWENWPGLALFRPERVGHDRTVLSAANYPADRAVGAGAISPPSADIHGLAYFNPRRTNLSTTEVTRLLGGNFVNTLQSTLCEDTNAESRVLSVPSREARRTPYPCRARYGTFTWRPGQSAPAVPGDDAYQSGLCYDVTLLSGVTARGAEGSSRWELRSAPLTFFILEALEPTAGRSEIPHGAVWVYPRNPGGILGGAPAVNPGPGQGIPASDVVTLPDFAAYDLGRRFPWWESASTLSPSIVEQAETTIRRDYNNGAPRDPVSVPTLCYQGREENPAAPAWCQFLFQQSWARTLYFDENGDGNVDASTTSMTAWSGRTDSTESVANRMRAIFEGITTADGRLFVINNMRGVFYSYNTLGACRADGFSQYYPISLLPRDSNARSRYPIAQTRMTSEYPSGEPFRDSAGQYIPFGSRQNFAYPWIDREGRNLMLSMVNDQRDAWYTSTYSRIRTDSNDPLMGDPALPGDSPLERHIETLATRAAHQVAVLGSWTGHKFVVLDNGINASDFGGAGAFTRGAQQSYVASYRLNLYRDASLDGFVPVGASLINSFENVHNQYDAMRPTLPFDVVWTASANNEHNAEIVFDEYMTDRAFVVAHMNAAVRIFADPAHTNPARGTSFTIPMDGFAPTQSWVENEWPGYTFSSRRVFGEPGPGQRVILQNAAAHSTVNNLRLRGGARVEPVALGGVLGKGVYFDGANDFVDMGFPVDTSKRDWYLGVWLDLRDPSIAPRNQPPRVVYYFADRSWIALQRDPANAERRRLMVYSSAENTVRYLSLGELFTNGRYAHLGVKLLSQGSQRVLETYVNGTYLGELRFATARGALGLDPMAPQSGGWTWMTLGLGLPTCGGVTAGSCPVSLQGWVDEFRMYWLGPAERTRGGYFDEFLCNTALGTLVRTDASSLPALTRPLESRITSFSTVAGARPAEFCEQLVLESYGDNDDLPRQYGRGVCVDRVHRNGGGPRCLRGAKLGQSPLHWSAERPTESGNAFCLSCHNDAQPVTGLRLAALADDPMNTARWLDRRRQPMNPPALTALPGDHCAAGWGLDRTWWASYVRADADPVLPSWFRADRVFDESWLTTAALIAAPGYFPPQPLAP